ncbi:molybdenum cofactor biosynthesis protein MoaE [Curtobacterium sp. Csp1]|uniref:molybdenum cofactor biosynthesis protein MoaE n=1 Tax=unclassified Curtobacterium TaxID=257496 RepID=UPI000E2C5AE1|nr:MULTISPECIES: molybdenum cofactor biosynthesis protein MoaE [unclassified Curtobacterium]QKS12376.1 molybdenum cofactor biosynthesis protein MoaE [Curtobacterium sp. csp3]QKS19961.1 molybdenum cofactor biosynthesis protein MoaE [Curtobacterium sp. Csp1]RDH98408.1 molybdopterin synthase subunit MoaE [Curtobacterium sp. AG1037]
MSAEQPGGQAADRGAGTSADRVVLADVVDRVVTVDEVSAAVATDQDGAVVTFAGIVRDHDGGKGVTALDYERHPSAAEVIAEVARTIADEHPEVRIAVLHRVGALGIGDVALAAAVASPHRGVAFTACGALVDLVKERTPIWKHQRFTDGSDEWVAAL